MGISVMKPFNAGQLLDAKSPPFRRALTTAQCIQYALDRPGVLTVLGGPGTTAQLKEALSYLMPPRPRGITLSSAPLRRTSPWAGASTASTATPVPRDWTSALSTSITTWPGRGDILAKEHYLTLEKTAADCIKCGRCNSRCPFKGGPAGADGGNQQLL